MKTRIKICLTLLAAGLSAGSALAQQGQIQQGAPQGAPQQVQQVQQNTTVTTGAQTQVTENIVEGNVGLSHIAICAPERFDCTHVINLLARKYDDERFGGGIIKPAPIVHHGFYGDHVVQPQLSDLELVSVCLADAGDVDHAPTYAITIANHGNVDICHFKVSAVAALCKIHQFCPTTTIRIDKICPGESITVEVVMPFAALAMGECNHRNPFDTLIVAIDAFDHIVECNELNNILILKRTAITVVEEQTQTTVEETTVESTTTAPVAPAVGENAETLPAPNAPTPDQKTSPLDSIDLDNLDLSGESEATGLLSFEGSPF